MGEQVSFGPKMLAGLPTHLPHCGAEGPGHAEHRSGAGPGSQCAADQGENTWQNPLSQSLALPVRLARISVESGISAPEK